MWIRNQDIIIARSFCEFKIFRFEKYKFCKIFIYWLRKKAKIKNYRVYIRCIVSKGIFMNIAKIDLSRGLNTTKNNYFSKSLRNCSNVTNSTFVFQNPQGWSLSFGAQMKAQIVPDVLSAKASEEVGAPVSSDKMNNINKAIMAYQLISPESKRIIGNFNQTKDDIENLISTLGLDEKHSCQFQKASPVILHDGTEGCLISKYNGMFFYEEGKNETQKVLTYDKNFEYNQFAHSLLYEEGVLKGAKQKSAKKSMVMSDFGVYCEGKKISITDSSQEQKECNHVVLSNNNTGALISYSHELLDTEDIITAKERICFNADNKPEHFYLKTQEWAGLNQVVAESAIEFDASGKPLFYYENILEDKENGIWEYDFKAKCSDDGNWVIAA